MPEKVTMPEVSRACCPAHYLNDPLGWKNSDGLFIRCAFPQKSVLCAALPTSSYAFILIGSSQAKFHAKGERPREAFKESKTNGHAGEEARLLMWPHTIQRTGTARIIVSFQNGEFTEPESPA